jgi:transcriptional regulator CtsR
MSKRVPPGREEPHKGMTVMGISDLIADFIQDALAQTDGVLELQRGELAQKFNCVPSQINYVMSTRFSPEHGYIVESRRGGNGYIRITRVRLDRKTMLMHAINAIGDEIDEWSACAICSNLLSGGVIEEHIAQIIVAAVSDKALRSVHPEERNPLRADILKRILIHAV